MQYTDQLHCDEVEALVCGRARNTLHLHRTRWKTLIAFVTRQNHHHCKMPEDKKGSGALAVPKYPHGSTTPRAEKWRSWSAILKSAFGMKYPVLTTLLSQTPDATQEFWGFTWPAWGKTNPKPKLDNHWEHWGRVNCKRSRCAVSVQRRAIGLEIRTAPWFHKNIHV